MHLKMSAAEKNLQNLTIVGIAFCVCQMSTLVAQEFFLEFWKNNHIHLKVSLVKSLEAR